MRSIKRWHLRSLGGKDEGAEADASASTKEPLWAAQANGGRHGRSPLQSSHPTRNVAWVRIVRHTYAYKRNPLFDRRVPAPITSTLKGFVISRWAIREPLRAELADNLATAAWVGRLADY